MSTYKIHKGADGRVKSFGANVPEFQPFLEDGDTLEYTDTLPPPTADHLFAALRMQRDRQIVDTNWLIERHRDERDADDITSLTTDQFSALLAYRQALRDLPSQPGAPWDGGGTATPWPVKPN